MRKTLLIGALAVFAVGAFALAASAQRRVVVPRGTNVMLAFDNPVDLSVVRTGDRLGLHVARDVRSRGVVIVRRGTPVTGTISRVGRHPGVGRQGRVRLQLSPVRTVYGGSLALQPRGLMRGNTIAGGRPLRVRAGERLLAVVPSRTVIALARPYGRQYGYGYGY